MSKWFKIYEDAQDDYRLFQLPAGVFKVWFYVLCNVSRQGPRMLKHEDALAIQIRMPARRVKKALAVLRERGLIGPNGELKHFVRPRTLRNHSNEWASLRNNVFHRDNYTCTYCEARGGKLECDHVIPVSRGGTDDMDNLVTACLKCNRAKRDKTLAEWRAVQQ